MKIISIVTPCYNEEDNLNEVYLQTKAVFSTIEGVRYEHIFIDNCSTDDSVNILRKLASEDQNVKVILNSRNFGWIRSPYHGLLQAQGDATVLLVADLQDPPELLTQFVAHWLAGEKIVIGVKPSSEESSIMFAIRRLYYRIVTRISDINLIQNFTGFGLYDKQVIEALRKIDDPYPYFRGLICEVGFPALQIQYNQPKRKRGVTKANFYHLYDVAMLGITSHSRIPLRLATLLGFTLSGISLLLSVCYLIFKILFWDEFKLGIAPVLIGGFFFASVQLFFIGLLGEYVGAILVYVMRRPLVVERERINF